jgi:ankyrin repeat protein
MLLLDTRSITLTEFPNGDRPKYAILSHVWGQEEVTLQDIQRSCAELKRGYKKVRDCCKRALLDGFNYVWIDTCCIDKTSSAELSEAINSMYTWYYEAGVCYAYLADVSSRNEIAASKWFTRGWTLQELIAPSVVIFLDQNWRELGNKEELRMVLSSHTGIPGELLCKNIVVDLSEYSVAQKMSWAASRTTTRVEDRAYSLLGIFGIYMPPIYGEGENAFIRLQEEIMRVSDDHSLFAWSSLDSHGGLLTLDNHGSLLARSPDAFRDSGHIVPYQPDDEAHVGPYISSSGIHLEVRFLGEPFGTGIGMAVLNCRYQSKEDESIAIFVQDLDLMMERFQRTRDSGLVEVGRNTQLQTLGSVRKICIRRPHSRELDVRRCNEALNKDNCIEYVSHWDGAISLMTASRKGLVHSVWYLLTFSSNESWLRRGEGRKAIFEAIQGGNEMVVRILLHRSGIRAHEMEEEQESPTAFLLAAVRARQHAIVKLLLKRRFRPDPSLAHRGKFTSALSLAAAYGLESIVKLLLHHGADVNWFNDKFQTPLCFAAEKGHENIVRILIDQGAKLDRTLGDTRIPLCYASEARYESIVRLLIERRASPHTLDNRGRSPLSLASERGHYKLAELLISNGAKIESEDRSHKTPLAYAATELEFETIRVLLKHGADIEAVDGESAMSLALDETHPDIMRAFSNHSALGPKVENHIVRKPLQGDRSEA